MRNLNTGRRAPYAKGNEAVARLPGRRWCPVSRLADHTGQPPVIVKMNAHVACAMTAASTNTTSASPAAKPRQHRAGR
jgi:hypothetical protein